MPAFSVQSNTDCNQYRCIHRGTGRQVAGVTALIWATSKPQIGSQASSSCVKTSFSLNPARILAYSFWQTRWIELHLNDKRFCEVQSNTKVKDDILSLAQMPRPLRRSGNLHCITHSKEAFTKHQLPSSSILLAEFGYQKKKKGVLHPLGQKTRSPRNINCSPFNDSRLSPWLFLQEV